MPKVAYRSEKATEQFRKLIAVYTKEHTMQQLAELLGVSYNTVFVWQQKGVPLQRAQQIKDMFYLYCLPSTKDSQIICEYNVGVNCLEEERRCEKCGWNPEVMAKRLEKYRSGSGRRRS